ncbi:hypothetical protein D3C83_40250 [compost metagenome]
MAERTRDADTCELASGIDRSLHTDDRIETKQFDSHCRVVQVDRPGHSQRGNQFLRQGLDIDLQTDA